MLSELSRNERCTWVWDTIETLANLFDRDDELLAYTVIEPLDVDAHSALSRANLDDLVEAEALSGEPAEAFVSIGATVTE